MINCKKLHLIDIFTLVKVRTVFLPSDKKYKQQNLRFAL